MFFACALLSLCGCVSSSSKLIEKHLEQAISNGFSQLLINTHQFTMHAQAKQIRGSATAVVYFEGDGRAWINKHRVSANPTPRNAVGFELAMRDRSRNSVVYLARPCQYLRAAEDPSCDNKYWTSHRYAPEVVASVNEAVDKLSERYGFEVYHFVGFSGGASVAVLVAAQRNDVASLITVAGNLDTNLFARIHEVSPLDGSLNPVDYAAALKNIPQYHLTGEFDEVVPHSIAQSYAEASGANHCQQIQRVKGARHESGWAEAVAKISSDISTHERACAGD